MVGDIEALLAERYPRVASRMLAPLIELLAQARRTHGDLDRLLILMSLAQRAYSDPAAAAALLGPEAGATAQPRATNTLSLAQAISLPKETVRRKLNELVAMGLADRQRGGVVITPAGVRHLAEARAAVIRMAAIHHDIVERLKDAA